MTPDQLVSKPGDPLHCLIEPSTATTDTPKPITYADLVMVADLIRPLFDRKDRTGDAGIECRDCQHRFTVTLPVADWNECQASFDRVTCPACNSRRIKLNMPPMANENSP